MPVRCIWCSSLGSVICDACSAKLLGPIKNVSRIGINGFSVNEYSNQIAILIHEFKENQQLSLAKPISVAMAPALNQFDLNNVLLVPMPSKKTSFAKRGFNPSEVLARNISHEFSKRSEFKIPVYRILKIKRTVADQAALSGEERRKNLVGSMTAAKAPSGYSAILVDDVITTGSTLLEAKRCLVGAGVAVQGFLTFAETPPQNVRKLHENRL